MAARASGFNAHQAVWARMKALAAERPHMAIVYNTEADSISLTAEEKKFVLDAISDLGINTEGW